MNTNNFKTNLKTILSNNKHKVIFKLGNKTYYTKRNFGLRLIELFNDKTTENIFLTSVKQQNDMYEQIVNGFDYLLENDLKNIIEMNFMIETKEQIKAYKLQQSNMTPMARAIQQFGTSA